jgi:hypothetical protein
MEACKNEKYNWLRDKIESHVTWTRATGQLVIAVMGYDVKIKGKYGKWFAENSKGEQVTTAKTIQGIALWFLAYGFWSKGGTGRAGIAKYSKKHGMGGC